MRKRKQRKKWCGVVCVIAMLLMTAIPVFADESPWIVDGSRLTEDTESMSEEMFDFCIEPVGDALVVPLATYSYGGTAKITNAGGGKVNVYANTKASTTCDKVELDIYLQYYNNGSWVHVNNWNYSVKNKAYLTASRTLSVTKGRYYRIKCYHAITKGSVREKSTTMTDGIPIK